MRAIGDLIAHHAPHVVALQEVTDEHWAELTAHPSLAAYDWSPRPEGASYYTMIGSLTAWSKLHQPHRVTYTNTGMGRDLLSAIVRSDGQPPLVLGTSHLESLNMVRARSEQIAELTGWLNELGEGSTDVVMCGDTNVASGSLKGQAVDEPVSLGVGWRDAWEAVGGQDGGYTFDAQTNRMVHRLDGWARVNMARLRFDRFWTLLYRYECVGVEMIGTSPLASDGDAEAVGEEIWPSDHFGVLLTMAVRPSAAS